MNKIVIRLHVRVQYEFRGLWSNRKAVPVRRWRAQIDNGFSGWYASPRDLFRRSAWLRRKVYAHNVERDHGP